MNKKEIESFLHEVREKNLEAVKTVSKSVELDAFSEYVRFSELDGVKYEIWTDAFNKALEEGGEVVVSEREEPYYIDGSIIMNSNSSIKAYGATIRQIPGVKVLMLRNADPIDETKYPAKGEKNSNISVFGGTWEEMRSERAGYGSSGMFDNERSMYGVSTAFLFSNVFGLTVSDATFIHTGGFAVQTGNAENVVFENIRFIECFADGLHINGNTKNVFIKNVKGNVGDDIVALNMYDWYNSSINFGPGKNIFCEDVELDENGQYKAIRLDMGEYTFADGTKADCGIENLVMKKVRGIKTFKLYLQTEPYHVDSPILIGTGSANNLYFEDIDIDLDAPIDELDNYMRSDRLTGSIAGFEIGANIGSISFENIRFKHYRDKFPMSYLICVGPKSTRVGDMEVFDPYVTGIVEKMTCSDISVNGEKMTDISDYVHCVVFDRIYDSDYASGYGKINSIEMK